MVKTKYVVGCNGAHSWTQKHLDVAFRGQGIVPVWGTYNMILGRQDNSLLNFIQVCWMFLQRQTSRTYGRTAVFSLCMEISSSYLERTSWCASTYSCLMETRNIVLFQRTGCTHLFKIWRKLVRCHRHSHSAPYFVIGGQSIE